MFEVGDLVKVTGKTISGLCMEEEVIPIGTICEVIDVDERDGTIEIVPLGNKGVHGARFWYFPKDLQKEHHEWIPEREVD